MLALAVRYRCINAITVANRNDGIPLGSISRQLTDGRRFRVIRMVDDCTQECLALIADTSLSSARVARELLTLFDTQGKPVTVVSENGLDFTSCTILTVAEGRKIDWPHIAGEQTQNDLGTKNILNGYAQPNFNSWRWERKGSCMVRSELVRKIAEANPQFAPEAVEAAVLVIFKEIEYTLARSNRVEIRGFGVFVTRARRAHMGRNPKNGVPVAIAAKHVPWFRASNLLLDRLK